MRSLVIGGSRGLGRAIAERLAGRGHRVGVLARSEGEVEAAVRSIRGLGGEASGLVADVLDVKGLRSAVRRYGEDSGGIDSMIFAAGRFRAIGPLEATEAEEWAADLETTLVGFANAAREAIPRLRRSECPSIAAMIGPGHAGDLAFGTAYGAAQAGLARLVESLAVELAPDRIPVFAVNPGLVPTSLMSHLLESRQGRRWLARFNEAFAEGKEVGPEVGAEMTSWLIETRPGELSGRVVASLLTPEIMATRLRSILAGDTGKLRLR